MVVDCDSKDVSTNGMVSEVEAFSPPGGMSQLCDLLVMKSGGPVCS